MKLFNSIKTRIKYRLQRWLVQDYIEHHYLPGAMGKLAKEILDKHKEQLDAHYEEFEQKLLEAVEDYLKKKGLIR